MVDDSRYFRTDDDRMTRFDWHDVTFPIYDNGWWSRVYEYAWLSSLRALLSVSNATAIDVATGKAHPGHSCWASAYQE